ncbi:GRIP and coiled-coil domain-containing protein C27D7.02c isoform X3 [Aristolochia californica]|uniref:GRIP and coiled-coil domain-containing protein C27D7.02c isoform X3 n=1 Tax=Aristolochia californica TaxID=171875 RepID=UPI0035E1AFAE
MEFLSLSKFKLQLQALIGETRDLRENESQARKDLHISIQKQKQSDADFSKMLQALREELVLCNESRKQLEIESCWLQVKCLQQENTMLEMKQRELRETINSLLQSRETFINSHEDSTCELKRSVEEKDKRLILLSQELQAHLKLFDSIQEEAFSVKQIVEKVECLVSEKEQVVAELKTKMDEISTYEKESIGIESGGAEPGIYFKEDSRPCH